MTKHAEDIVAAEIGREWVSLINSKRKYGRKTIYPVTVELIHAIAHEVMGLRQSQGDEPHDLKIATATLRSARAHVRRAHLDFLKYRALEIQLALKRGDNIGRMDFLQFTSRLLHCRENEFKSVGDYGSDATFACFKKLLHDFEPKDDIYIKDSVQPKILPDSPDFSDEAFGQIRQLFCLVIIYNTLKMRRDTELDVKIVNLYLTKQLTGRALLLIYITQLFILDQIVNDLCPDGELEKILGAKQEWANIKARVETICKPGGRLPSVVYTQFVENRERLRLPIAPPPLSTLRAVEMLLKTALDHISVDCAEACPLPTANKDCDHSMAIAL